MIKALGLINKGAKVTTVSPAQKYREGNRANEGSQNLEHRSDFGTENHTRAVQKQQDDKHQTNVR